MTSQPPAAPRRIARQVRSRLTRPEAARLDQLEAELARSRAELEELRRSIEAERTAWASGFDASIRGWVEEYIGSLRDHLIRHGDEAAEAKHRTVETRIRRLERSTRRADAPTDAPPASSGPTTAPVASGALDAAPTPSNFSYESFEDVMRGDPTAVAALQAQYVERLTALPHPELPVIDVGCGRGELLALLGAAGQRAYGIDMSTTFVEDCHDAGLEAICGDGIAHLATLAPGSVRAVTAFHVVEHLTLDQQLAFLAQCHRVLAPGGAVVLETPNPENLRVGACSFWLDPTHLRPIPPPLLSFLVGEAGFEEIEVLRLHPDQAGTSPDGEDDAPVAEWLTTMLRGPMDYAVIGHRAADEA